MLTRSFFPLVHSAGSVAFDCVVGAGWAAALNASTVDLKCEPLQLQSGQERIQVDHLAAAMEGAVLISRT